MNIVILGGTGFVGRHLCRSLVENGHRVTALTRSPQKASSCLASPIVVKQWDPLQLGTLENELEGHDAIINLAGEPIAEGRWTESRKKNLCNSRVHLTYMVVKALSNLREPPRILINASAIGYYGSTDMTPVDEQTPAGIGFLADLCVGWEKEAALAHLHGTRVVSLRIGMVLAKDGGALAKMLLPFQFFVGGPILPGTQPVSWIHRTDLIQLIQFILNNETISGPVNAVAPQPSTMREFCQALGLALNRPSWFPVPEFVLNIGLGELATLMTTGQAVNPAVATQSGFTYKFPTLDSALEAIVKE